MNDPNNYLTFTSNATNFKSPTPIGEPVLARVIRYTVVPKNIDIVKSLGIYRSILMDGIAVVNDNNVSLYLEIAPDVTRVLEKLNEELLNKSWTDKDGISHPYRKQTFEDIDIIIEVVKAY